MPPDPPNSNTALPSQYSGDDKLENTLVCIVLVCKTCQSRGLRVPPQALPMLKIRLLNMSDTRGSIRVTVLLQRISIINVRPRSHLYVLSLRILTYPPQA